MNTKPYFKDIEGHIASELERAQSSIKLAMAWFTNPFLFEKIKQISSMRGVSVQILLMKDDINEGTHGLDFSTIYGTGIKVIWIPANEQLMHHKYCVIDEKTVISGSYNWTRKAKENHENITITNDSAEFAQHFIKSFDSLWLQYNIETIDSKIGELDNPRYLGNLSSKYDEEIDRQSHSGIFRQGIFRQYTPSEFIEGLKELYRKEGWSFKVRLNDKWGLTDVDGNEITLIKYDQIIPINDGAWLIVKIKDKWGFVDKDGNEVTPLKYDLNADSQIWRFSEGLAIVILGDRCSYIDEKGNEVIPLKYSYGGMFKEGRAWVTNDHTKYGFIDKKGNEITHLKYNRIGDFSEGRAMVGLLEKIRYKAGYIDRNGNEVIPLKYDFVGSSLHDFKEGRAGVSLNNKWGFIDIAGNEVIPLKYDEVSRFEDGLSMVKLNNKMGFIDKCGNVLIPLKYEKVYGFSENLSMVTEYGETFKIDKIGNEYNWDGSKRNNSIWKRYWRLFKFEMGNQND